MPNVPRSLEIDCKIVSMGVIAIQVQEYAIVPTLECFREIYVRPSAVRHMVRPQTQAHLVHATHPTLLAPHASVASQIQHVSPDIPLKKTSATSRLW